MHTSNIVRRATHCDTFPYFLLMEVIADWVHAASRTNSALGVTHVPFSFCRTCFPVVFLRKLVCIPSTVLSIAAYRTQVYWPNRSTPCVTTLWKISSTLGSAPYLLSNFTNLPHTLRDSFMCRLNASQSLSVWSRGHPRYLNFKNPSTIVPPYLPYRLNFI